MNIIQNIFTFFKNIFSPHKMIALPVANEIIDEPVTCEPGFIDSIKVEAPTIIKPRNLSKTAIKTLICVGDGLGIQTKIEY